MAEQVRGPEPGRIEARRPGGVGEAARAGPEPSRVTVTPPAGATARSGLGGRASLVDGPRVRAQRRRDLAEGRIRGRRAPPARAGRGRIAGCRRGGSRRPSRSRSRPAAVRSASWPRASVSQAIRSTQPCGLEAVDEPGDPAPRQEDPLGEDVHPDPPSRRRRDLEQRVVLGEGQAVGRLELVVEPAGDPGMRLEEASPRGDARRIGDRRCRRMTGVRADGRVIGRGGHAEILPFRQIVDNSTICRGRRIVAPPASTEDPMTTFDVEALRRRFPALASSRTAGRSRSSTAPAARRSRTRSSRRSRPTTGRRTRTTTARSSRAAGATPRSTRRIAAMADLLGAATPARSSSART